MRRIFTFAVAVLSLLCLGSQLYASAAAGGPAPAEQPSMCPNLTIRDFNDIAANNFEMPEGIRWTTIEGPGLSLQSWSQGVNPGVEIKGVRQKIAADTLDKNLAALAKKKNQRIEILKLTTHLIPLTADNVGPGKFFNYIPQSDSNKVGCTYSLHPAIIGRPGPLKEGIIFSLCRFKLPGEEVGNPPTAEQQVAGQTAYKAQIKLPLKLRSLAEVAYMNGLSADSAEFEAPPAAASLPFQLPELMNGALDLTFKDIKPAGAIALADYLRDHQIPGLSFLSLGYNSIGESGIKALAPELPYDLRNLDLIANNIGNGGIQALAPDLPENLAILVLARNNIGDVGIQALAPHLPPDLENLDLGQNNISDVGIQALAPKLPASLAELNLGRNPIGNAGIQALVNNMPVNLKTLLLYNTDIDGTGIQALTNAGFVNSGREGIWIKIGPASAAAAH